MIGLTVFGLGTKSNINVFQSNKLFK